jgi:hypothetical protein
MHDLLWIEPDDKRHAYILKVDGAESGWLQFDKPAEEYATGAWCGGSQLTFEPGESQVPFPSVTVRENGKPVVTFTHRWNAGGTAVFESGSRYCWNPAHIWSSTWCFRREGSRTAICQQEAFPLNSGGKGRCDCDAAPAAEVKVLVLLGWYLRVVSRGLQAETIIP